MSRIFDVPFETQSCNAGENSAEELEDIGNTLDEIVIVCAESSLQNLALVLWAGPSNAGLSAPPEAGLCF